MLSSNTSSCFTGHWFLIGASVINSAEEVLRAKGKVDSTPSNMSTANFKIEVPGADPTLRRVTEITNEKGLMKLSFIFLSARRTQGYQETRENYLT